MAKTIITIEDNDEENGISVKLEFDPPITTETMDEREPTPAESAGMFCLEAFQRQAKT